MTNDISALREALASPEQYRCNCSCDDSDYIQCDMCSRIARILDRLENAEARNIHTCHERCEKAGCINRRLRKQVKEYEAALRFYAAAENYTVHVRTLGPFGKSEEQKFEWPLENARSVLSKYSGQREGGGG